MVISTHAVKARPISPCPTPSSGAHQSGSAQTQPLFLPPFSKEKVMTSNGAYVSLYEQRVKLVADALTAHSKLKSKASTELAAHVLYALDHIPERVRYTGK